MKRLYAAVASSLVSVIIVAGLATPSSGASEISDVGLNSLAQVASCVAQQKSLLVAIVVDESRSLQDNDPDDVRVEAIETALGSLESLADQPTGAIDVQATLATFGTSYRTLVDWTSIDSPALRSTAQTELPKSDDARLTDYRKALEGAQEKIEDRATASDCKLILWFTDGKLDLNDNGRYDKAETDVEQELCTNSPIVDDLRESNITLVALALFLEERASDNAPALTTPRDRDLLRAIAEGSGGDQSCGRAPIPETWSGGAYLRAANVDALRAVFAQAGALIEGFVQGPALVCSGPTGENCVLKVPVDKGVSGVRLDIFRSLDDIDISVTAPGRSSQTAITLDPVDIGDSRVQATTGVGLTSIDLTVGSNHGDWSFSLSDPEAGRNLFYSWGANLVLDVPEGFVIGEDTPVPFRLESASREVIDTTVYKAFNLEPSALGTEGVAVAIDWEQMALIVNVSGNSVASEIAIEVKATAVSRPSNIPLGPIFARATALAVPPEGSPTVGTPLVDFGLMETNEATASILLNGPDPAEGLESDDEAKACFKEIDFSSPEIVEKGTEIPEIAGKITITPQAVGKSVDDAGCVSLSPGERDVEVELTLKADDIADGNIRGWFPIELKGVNGTDSVKFWVPVEAEMERPIDWWEAAGYSVLAVVLALLLAWLTAVLSSHLADRFRFGPNTKYCGVDVDVTPEGIRRTNSPTDVIADPVEDFRPVSKIGGAATTTSQVIHDPKLHFTRKSLWVPWRRTRGVVSAPGRIIASGQHAEMESPDGSLAPARFPGTTDFLLVANPGDITPERATGQLVMMVDAPNGVSAVLPERLAELRAVDWRPVLMALNAAADTRSEGATKANSKGKSGGSPGKIRGGTDHESSPTEDLLGSDGPPLGSSTSSLPADDWLLGDDSSRPTLSEYEDKGNSRWKRNKRSKGSKPDTNRGPSTDDDAPPDFLS